MKNLLNVLVVISIVGGAYFTAGRPELYKLVHVLVLIGIAAPIGKSWANSFTNQDRSRNTNQLFEYSWLRGAWTSKLLDFKSVNGSDRRKLANELFDERYVALLLVILGVWIFFDGTLRISSNWSAVQKDISWLFFMGLFFGYAVIAIAAKLIAGAHIYFDKQD